SREACRPGLERAALKCHYFRHRSAAKWVADPATRLCDTHQRMNYLSAGRMTIFGCCGVSSLATGTVPNAT
ncbi:MAG: hypothetical protein ABGZ53_23445, partial [Fuerstiella sp.]